MPARSPGPINMKGPPVNSMEPPCKRLRLTRENVRRAPVALRRAARFVLPTPFR